MANSKVHQMLPMTRKGANAWRTRPTKRLALRFRASDAASLFISCNQEVCSHRISSCHCFNSDSDNMLQCPTSIKKVRSMPPKSAPPNTERHMKGANQTSQQSKQDKNKRKRNKTNKKTKRNKTNKTKQKTKDTA